MPKRKRDETDEDTIDKIDDRAIRIKASRLRVKIDSGNKSLKSALQLARGFERQKLGRRQKQASKEPHTLLRLREEVIILKELDAGKTARDYLFKQLVKTKKIRESAAFIALYGEDAKVEGSKSVAEGNVLGRLFKANPIKEVLPDILKGIRDVLGLDRVGVEGGGTNGVEKTAETASKVEIEPEEGGEFDGFSDSPEMDQALNVRRIDAEVDDVSDGDDGSDDDGIDYDAYNDRLAGSSDSEEEDDNDDISIDMPITTQPLNRQPSISPSIDYASDSSSSPQPQPKLKKPSKPPPEPKSYTSTAFLPSLSMGGYYSGSDSDSDTNTNVNGFNPDRGPPSALQRTNRRGQRARQQIAEKKYGQAAKHLAKRREKEGRSAGGRDGWDSRKGAVENDGKGGDRSRSKSSGGRFGGRGTGSRGPTVSGANGDVVGKRRDKPPKKDEGPLHPSWEAARRKKEEQGGGVAFKGKKVVFD